ncbi:MAG: hypothetical protein JRF45_04610 [Deltaproteobacteria bacterium]|nr:hypothetical protein [Deltaproteobacteria bacterium]MBW2156397.1 hypothetical protein [Deltaproteobacteria bacterium]MBW2325775.1 hypothetical protein [Deltaproteobacteria bacterium]MBW2555481.1 hypothetical protein [Deltaproteobacteria bacterium]
MKIGMYINFPGNHCLEYSEREIIGKYNTFVVQISILTHMDISPSKAFPDVPANAMATTVLLTPK